VEIAVAGELQLSAFIRETKAEPRRSQYRSSVYLYQYCMLIIIMLEEVFNVIYKILCQAAEQTENFSVCTEFNVCD